MSKQENTAVAIESIALPYRNGEFQEVAERISRLADSLTAYPNLSFVTQELRGAAAALCRAEGLLAVSTPTKPTAVPVELGDPGVVTTAAAAPEDVPATEGNQERGTRGEWKGNVGHQPDYDRLQDGRIRAVFFLGQHPDPNDREKTEWIRCYSLGRHAESLQAKGRLAGAKVLVRGTLQGVRPYTRKDGTTVEQPTVYCYGLRVVRPAKAGVVSQQ